MNWLLIIVIIAGIILFSIIWFARNGAIKLEEKKKKSDSTPESRLRSLARYGR